MVATGRAHCIHNCIYNHIYYFADAVPDGTHRFTCYSSVSYSRERPHSSGKNSKRPLTDNAGDITKIQMYACASK